MDNTVNVDGTDFVLVVEQRSGPLVYRASDRYMRLGEPETIARDIETHRRMERLGFPVAAIISTGTRGGMDYFIERSLGDKRFRDLFEEDLRASGVVSDEHFGEFVSITKRYLEAQSKALVGPDAESFAHGIHLDILRAELPQYAISLKDQFGRILQKLAGFPYVLTHGDFNPANMYPTGVIDLEDSFMAPFGFDAVSAISTIECFPDSPDFEFYARYRFTSAQRSTYLSMCDTVSAGAGFSSLSMYYGDFAFCREIWSLVRMHEWPKLQAWRYEKFIKRHLFS